MSKADLGCIRQAKSELEDHPEQWKNENITVGPRKGEEGGLKMVEVETLVKQELDETDSGETPIHEILNETDSGETPIHETLPKKENASHFEQLGTKGNSLIGQLKVRPLASLAALVRSPPSPPEAKPVADTQNPIRASFSLSSYSLPKCFNNGHQLPTHIPPHSSTFRLDTTSASTAITNSFLAQKNTFATDCQVEEEFDIEKTAVSLETAAVCSASTIMNVIIKPELDLLDSLGNYQGQPDPINLNNLGDGFLTSDEIYSGDKNDSVNVSKTHSTGSKKKVVVDPYHDVAASDLRPQNKRTGKLLCKGCDFRYDKKNEVKFHAEKLHSAKYNYRCFICTTAAFNRKKSPYDLPAYKLPSFRALVFHVATVHRGEKRKMCLTCDRHFKTEKAVKNHMDKVHQIVDPFACHLCSVNCKSLAALKKHHSNNHDETLQECPICKKTIKQMSLANHIRQHDHTNKKEMTRKCVKCDFTTTRKVYLEKHYRVTRHHKLFHCELCTYGTSVEEDFKNHLNSKHQPYVCEFPGCDKTFYMEEAYTTHSRIHLFAGNRKVYSCVLKDCDFQTLIYCHLKRHYKKTKHRLPFGCPDCSARYSKEELVASHIQKVHVENIVRERGFDSPAEDISGAVEIQDSANDVEVYSGDRYEHFKKGWLGISCLGEEKHTNTQPSYPTSNLFPSIKTQCGSGHIIPVFSKETSSDFSTQNHDGLKLSNREHPCDTEKHDLLNYTIDGEDGTRGMVSNYQGLCGSFVQADHFMFKANPEMPSNNLKIQGNENVNIIVTSGMEFETSDINDQTQVSVKLEKEELHCDTEAHETMIVTPNIDFLNSSSDQINMDLVNRTPGVSLSEVHVGDLTIKPDPDLYDYSPDSNTKT